MAAPALITEPEAVTAPWLTEVMGRAELTRPVTALSHEPVGTGLMARSHRFRFSGDGCLQSVVIKFPSADAATRTLGASAYRREVGFYRDVATAMPGAVPRCYHADVSESGEDFVLVLEDIAPARQGDQIQGCNIDDAARALATLARVHASTWHDVSVAQLPWLGEAAELSLDDLMALALDAFEQRFAGRLATSTWSVLRAFAGNADRWRALQPPRRAAVHGDYRLDNLLFAATGDAVTAVDWQTVAYASPGRDLAYFLGNSLTVEDRRQAEHELVERYLDELRGNGVDGYGRTECWADIRHGAFQGPLTTMLGAFVTVPDDRSDQMFTVMADRSAAQILELDALELLR